MGIPVTEQETIIQFSRDSDEASVWTSDSTMMTKLDKLVDYKNWYRVKTEKVDSEVIAKEYKTNKHLISFRAKKTERVMTDGQRQALSERLKATRIKSTANSQ